MCNFVLKSHHRGCYVAKMTQNLTFMKALSLHIFFTSPYTIPDYKEKISQ